MDAVGTLRSHRSLKHRVFLPSEGENLSMSERSAEYRARYLASVTEKLGQPAEAVGVFTRPGSVGAAFAVKTSGLAWLLMNRRGKQRSGGLPLNIVLGVTADTVYAFPFKPRGMGIKLGDPVARWDRSQIRVERVAEGMVADRLRFHLGDGSSIELDSTTMLGGASDLNAPLIGLLGG